jgi:hypothetical protein
VAKTTTSGAKSGSALAWVASLSSSSRSVEKVILVALTLDVPLLAAVGGVLVGDDVAALVARAAVPLHFVELAGALGEEVDEALEVVGGEVFEVMGVVGCGCGGQALPPIRSQQARYAPIDHYLRLGLYKQKHILF